jgi:nitrous oxide reductase accessory protein NosL
MKSLISMLACLLVLAACSQTETALEPIPGSITYGGQPHMKLTESPVGARIPHHFMNDQGQDVYETYILQPDRSLKLVSRQVMTIPF